HRECDRRREYRQAIEITNLFAGLLRDNDQDFKAQESHHQISREIKCDSSAIEAGNADEQITGVRDAGVAEQTLQIVLWERGKISVSNSKQCDKRSEEHTSELQSRVDLVCRLLLEKKKKYDDITDYI